MIPIDENSEAASAPGILMGIPERAFVIALRSGWEWVKANPSAWDVILRGADPVELAAAKELFGEGGRLENPKIRTGYPTRQAEIPQITVLIEAEQTREAFLGDSLYQGDDGFLGDDEGFDGEALNGGAQQIGELRDQVLTISITTTHPDVALYLYRATDMILTAHKDWFVKSASESGAGLKSAEFMSGGAVIPDPREPERLWGRQLKWKVSGLVGSFLPIPPPKLGVEVRPEGVIQGGRDGRVVVA